MWVGRTLGEGKREKTGADGVGGWLTGVDLTGADLLRAKVTEEQLATCNFLERATMPNGQKYEDWVKSREEGDSGS
jgi:hypothetical protein